MKNEEGITELLAESLKKQDKQEVILNRHTQLLEKLVDSQVALAEEFRQLRSDFKIRQECSLIK